MSAFEFRKSSFCNTPKVLYSVYMIVMICNKLIISTLYFIVFSISKGYKAIICFETICIYSRSVINPALNYWYKLTCRAIFNYLSICFPSSFYEPKNYRLSFSTPTSDPTYSPCSKGLSFPEYSAIFVLRCFIILFIELRLMPVNTAILLASISKEKCFIIFRNFLFEIRERFLYLLFIARQYLNFFLIQSKLS